jgi:hypothetical protein
VSRHLAEEVEEETPSAARSPMIEDKGRDQGVASFEPAAHDEFVLAEVI